MSSILKALRKLEDEKAEVGQGQVDLARDILKRSFEKRNSSPVWLIIISGMVLFFAAGGLWIYLSFTEESLPVSSVTIAPVLPSESEITTPAPTTPTVELSPVVLAPPLEEQSGLQASSKAAQQARPAAKTPLVVQPPPENVMPQLNIEEIIYHAEPASRLAVINDLPVMEGTDIDGARVLEILPDRVRLTFQGVEFQKFKSAQD